MKTPVKKGRKRKSVEGENESKVTPGKVSKRASRRTRGTKSEESSSSLTEEKEEKEKPSEATPAKTETSEGEKSVIAEDKQNIENIVNKPPDNDASQPESEKSPKMRGRKPGSKNKPK